MKRDERKLEETLDQHLGLFNTPSADQMEVSRERILTCLRSDTNTAIDESTPLVPMPRPWRGILLAAAAVVLVAFLVAPRFGPLAVMETAAGTRYIKAGETVRSNGLSSVVLVLKDGSRVEMRSNSELSLSAANDGLRILLNGGSVIVTAAEQRNGHLYVETKDMTGSVVGTVFLVNAEAEGSRVAVIQGEVQVEQSGARKNLKPGEQAATAQRLESLPVAQEILWSRNAEAHLALLHQSLAPVPAPPAAEEGSGVVAVKVTNALTGKGLESAKVTLVPVEPLKTGEDGFVTFTGLAPQNYVFRIERAGYVPVDLGKVPNYVSVGPNERKNLQLAMHPVAVVNGLVLNNRGTPLPNAGVVLMSIRYVAGRKTLVRERANPTDDRGEYRFPDVPPGEYYLRVDNSGLLGSDAAPDRLPRTVYYPGVVDLAFATRLVVRGQDLLATHIRMPAEPVFSVSGTVVNSLSPVQDSEGRVSPRGVSSFFLGSADPNALADPIIVSSRIRGAPDAEESPFELSGLSPGTYVLYPYHGLPSIRMGTNPTTIRIEDRDVTGLRIELKPGGNLQGRVVVEGDASTIPLQTIALGIRAKDRIPTTMIIGARMSPASAQTGEFVITDVIQNVRLRLLVNGLPADAYVSDIRQGGNSVLSDGFIWSTPSKGLIEVRLSSRGGSVQGIVRDASQQPVKQGAVVLIPDERRRGNPLLYRRVLTDNGGRFGLRGVPPGDYKMFAAQTVPIGAEEDPEYFAQYEGRAMTVTVAAGTPVEVQMPIQ